MENSYRVRSLASVGSALAVVVAVAGALAAQSPTATSSPAAREKMKALEFLVGEWQGDAWMQMGPDRREEASQREWVELEAGGEVLLIQGRGESGGRVVHEALATIVWDQRAGRYEMWTYRAGSGAAARPSIEVGDQRVVWGFDTPQGKIRYTIGLDAEGRWVEVGERSGDGGSTWTEFFGMTLRKTKKSGT
jgi:hypothetical protein